MSITIKRNTGWLGMGTKIEIRLNGKKVGSVEQKDYIDLELPEDKSSLKVTQFGAKSNEILVKDGDMVEITSTIYNKIIVLLPIVLLILSNFTQDSINKPNILILSYALFIISIFFFNKFHLKVIPEKIN